MGGATFSQTFTNATMSLNLKGVKGLFQGLRNEQTATELPWNQTHNRLKIQFRGKIDPILHNKG